MNDAIKPDALIVLDIGKTNAKLALIDAAGRVLAEQRRPNAVLADGPQSAGTSAAVWTPTGLPAGVYLARLSVDGAPRGTATVHLSR